MSTETSLDQSATTQLRHEMFQTEKFKDLRNAMKDGFDDLKKTTKDGFDSLLQELRVSREQGHIPLSVMKEMLVSNNAAYQEMMKASHEAFKEARKSSDESYSKILRQVCWMMAAVLVWVTGMKIWLPDVRIPDKIVQQAEKNPEKSENK